jgi:hypothetical protein
MIFLAALKLHSSLIKTLSEYPEPSAHRKQLKLESTEKNYLFFKATMTAE